jgi:hypothetical protein
MKRNLLILLAITILSVNAFGFADFAKQPSASFISGVYASHGEASVMVGTTVPLTKGLYNISYGNAGIDGNIGSEIALFVQPNLSLPLYVGFIAGPNVSSYGGGEIDPITYITGATGLIATYGYSWGGWIAGKYNFQLEINNFKNNWMIGGGFFYNIR